MDKKILASGKYWVCENMDLLSPIVEEGTMYLLTDGTKVKDSEADGLEWVSADEFKAYASQDCGIIFKGDEVVIKRGRKMVGEKKIVNGYYKYEVAGTYGHKYTEYLLFTDGTKVNIDHCDVVGIQHKNFVRDGKVYYERQYEESLEKYSISVGGRVGR